MKMPRLIRGYSLFYIALKHENSVASDLHMVAN